MDSAIEWQETTYWMEHGSHDVLADSQPMAKITQATVDGSAGKGTAEKRRGHKGKEDRAKIGSKKRLQDVNVVLLLLPKRHVR